MNKFSTPTTVNGPRARPFALATPDPTPRSRYGVTIASPTRWADAKGCTPVGTHAANTWPHPRAAQSTPAIASYTPMSGDHTSTKHGYRGTEDKFQQSYRKSTEGIVPGCAAVCGGVQLW